MSNHTKFKIGDRVEFAEDYRVQYASTQDKHFAYKGDVVTVVNSNGQAGSRGLIFIKKGNGETFGVFPYRLKKAEAKAVTKPYSFKVGDKGKTRGGDDYEVIMVRSGANQPVIATINDGISGEDVETFCSDGRYYENAEFSADDLLPPKRERTVYLNVYKNGEYVYGSEAEARRYASTSSALIVAHPVTIELPA